LIKKDLPPYGDRSFPLNNSVDQLLFFSVCSTVGVAEVLFNLDSHSALAFMSQFDLGHVIPAVWLPEASIFPGQLPLFITEDLAVAGQLPQPTSFWATAGAGVSVVGVA